MLFRSGFSIFMLTVQCLLPGEVYAQKTLGQGSEKIVFWLQKHGLVAQKTDTKCLDAKITQWKCRQGNVYI